ncbi:SDR family NAD(P)-dependent oxidoreductase [Raineyella sp. LH-20]|uniref:SDR family NAD(P)-dependent oxidoreductase n=1 Tax=Raineyella sp. LH-20 TaxID=3081204 RepID=UPI0029550E11|nr:SDR family oxidoreductase [Raineyella sp. LH-20]WOP19629.1 SDR family oxidoreductase [Raineyella sp. LH-20]
MTPLLEDLFSLSGKVAVVLGASGAIGSEAARTLHALGANVVLSGHSVEKLDQVRASLPSDGRVSVVAAGDCRDQHHVEDVAELSRSLGGVDILVDSIGTQRRRPLLEATSEDLDYLWSVNVAGVFAMTQALLPQMVAKGYGKVVHLCSIGSFVGLVDKTMYAITKGALAQYTRSSAVEMAPHGVRINAIAPGYVETPMTYDYIHSEREAEFLSAIPLGRFAQLGDLAGAFAYLTTPASDHVTGQVLVIDGGETV